MDDNACTHPVQMHGLCAVCGLDLTESNVVDAFAYSNDGTRGTDSPMLHILHTTPHIKVTPQEAARIDAENMQRLLGERKLSLVVDLDQTVLHATVDGSVSDWLHDASHPNHQFSQDIYRVALHDSPHVYHVKLRPGLEQFVADMARMFELHIYTMGSRSYAHAVVRLFDPDGQLFHDRILSRDDSEVMENRKKLTRIFPTDDRMVVVIDDRADVWPDCPNLLQVPAYSFFVGTGDINNPLANSNNGTTRALDAQAGVQTHTVATVVTTVDDRLASMGKVLERIHQTFFAAYDADSQDLPDVKRILPRMKQDVFSGLVFVFSGILNSHIAYEEQYIWRVAVEFGARCETELSDDTTHLISSRDDTEKMLEAMERQIATVRPEWLLDSVGSWRRLDCEPYVVRTRTPSRTFSKRQSEESLRTGLKRGRLDGMDGGADGEVEDEVDDEADGDSDGDSEHGAVMQPLLSFDAEDLAEINRELEEMGDFEDAEDSESERRSEYGEAPASEAYSDDSSLADLESSLF